MNNSVYETEKQNAEMADRWMEENGAWGFDDHLVIPERPKIITPDSAVVARFKSGDYKMAFE